MDNLERVSSFQIIPLNKNERNAWLKLKLKYLSITFSHNKISFIYYKNITDSVWSGKKCINHTYISSIYKYCQKCSIVKFTPFI